MIDTTRFATELPEEVADDDGAGFGSKHDGDEMIPVAIVSHEFGTSSLTADISTLAGWESVWHEMDVASWVNTAERQAEVECASRQIGKSTSVQARTITHPFISSLAAAGWSVAFATMSKAEYEAAPEFEGW